MKLGFFPSFLLLLISSLPMGAAGIEWSFEAVSHASLSQPATVSVVSNVGILHDAVNVGGPETIVNGITFAAGSGDIDRTNSNWSVPGVSWGSNTTGFYAPDASTLGNPGDMWLNSAKWSGSTAVDGRLNVLNLIPGNHYQVQLFFADNRTVYSTNGRTVSLDKGVTKNRYGFAPAGGPYGYLAATGVFTADTSSQSVDMRGYTAASAGLGSQINAFQIRDITAVLPSPPHIISHPSSRSAVMGDRISLMVTASGAEPLSYQWYLDGDAIAGAEDNTLVLPGLAAADAGSYTVTVSNTLGVATSDPAIIAIIDPLDPIQAIEAYHPVWTTPSLNDRGAMPLGNGEVGLMLWVEANGDLQFYISRTDSRTELDRLVKLGKVRLALSPNPFATGQSFRQELVLRDGRAEIQAGPPGNRVTLEVFVDSDSPTIYVSGTAASPLTVKATYETWRKQDYTGNVGSSPLAGSSFPNLYESADVLDSSSADRLSFYHRNAWSCVAKVAEVQFMAPYLADIPDTLAGRTFGGSMTLTGASISGGNSLLTGTPVTDFQLKITTHTAQTPAAADWLTAVTTLHSQTPDAAAAMQRTSQWWHNYWDRSWLYIHGDGPPEPSPIGRNQLPLRIGADSNGSNLFSGSMARASFYGRVLDAAEIALVAAGTPDSDVTVTSGLAASWLLGNTNGGTCPGRLGTSIPLSTSGAVSISNEGGVGHAHFEGGNFFAADDSRFEPTAGVTMEAWIRLDAGEANNGRLFDKTTANQQDGYLFDLYPGRALRIYNGFDGLVTASNILSVGAWHHVLVTYDNATKARALYLDGVRVAEQGGNPSGSVGEDSPSAVTRAYLLTKWMTACGARGHFPIMFNGSLWTVNRNMNPITIANNPDFRNWDHAYFYQNTRLNYLSMPARGELDFMQPFFDLYHSFEPLNRKRAPAWHGTGVEGQFNNEMATSFGLLPGSIYGYSRGGWPKWYTQNQYGGTVTISPGLELLALMLDAYDQSRDPGFLQSRILPYATDLFRFIETRFPDRSNGLIQMSPLHSVETFHNTTNSMPVVAGMQAVLDRILALPSGSLSPAQLATFTASRALTPPLPTQQINGKTVFAPAEVFTNSRMNVEEPEHYATFPFLLCGIGRPNRQIGIDTFEQISLANNYYKPFAIGGPLYVNSFSGWQQTPMAAALLGRTADAKQALTTNSRLYSSDYRLPAMWGQIYDSVPDGDHGANILNTAQLMAFQTLGDKIFLLPAWPKDWDVSFKFHAPGATVVSGRLRDGVMDRLEVSPPSRANDIVLMSAVPLDVSDSHSVSAYDAARIARFVGADLTDPGIWVPTADPDGDGLANLVELALGLDPLVANANPVRLETQNIGGNRYLTMTVDRDPTASGILITAESATHLGDPAAWSDSDLVVEVNTPSRFRVRTASLVGSESHRFYRFRFSVP